MRIIILAHRCRILGRGGVHPIGAACSVKHGRYHRFDDAQSIQRFRCTACGKCHSSATHVSTYRQKRRRLNRLIEMDLGSSTSQRRIAIKHESQALDGCDFDFLQSDFGAVVPEPPIY